MAYPTVNRRLVGVSLKMYFDLHETTSYMNAITTSDGFDKAVGEAAKHETTIFVIPSFPALSLSSGLKGNRKCAWLGAQDCHWEDSGAYTGEVSPLMLAQLGCKIVELGHAERRRPPINETDDIVAKKVLAVVRNRMIPLVCIGEKDRSSIASQAVGIAVEQCKAQILAPIRALREGSGLLGKNDGVIFAYEPVWAIGASEPASADHVLAVIIALRKVVGEEYNGEARFLYGGSAGPGTWEKLKDGCDGLFLGRFAHDVDNFVKVIQEVAAS